MCSTYFWPVRIRTRRLDILSFTRVISFFHATARSKSQLLFVPRAFFLAGRTGATPVIGRKSAFARRSTLHVHSLYTHVLTPGNTRRGRPVTAVADAPATRLHPLNRAGRDYGRCPLWCSNRCRRIVRGHVDGFPQSKCRRQVAGQHRRNSPRAIVGRRNRRRGPQPLPRRGRPPPRVYAAFATEGPRIARRVARRTSARKREGKPVSRVAAIFP